MADFTKKSGWARSPDGTSKEASAPSSQARPALIRRGSSYAFVAGRAEETIADPPDHKPIANTDGPEIEIGGEEVLLDELLAEEALDASRATTGRPAAPPPKATNDAPPSARAIALDGSPPSSRSSGLYGQVTPYTRPSRPSLPRVEPPPPVAPASNPMMAPPASNPIVAPPPPSRPMMAPPPPSRPRSPDARASSPEIDPRASQPDLGRGSYADLGRGSYPDLGRGSYPDLGRGSYPDLGRGSYPDGAIRTSFTDSGPSGPPDSGPRTSPPGFGTRSSHPDLASRSSHPDLASRSSHPDLASRSSHPDLSVRPPMAAPPPSVPSGPVSSPSGAAAPLKTRTVLVVSDDQATTGGVTRVLARTDAAVVVVSKLTEVAQAISTVGRDRPVTLLLVDPLFAAKAGPGLVTDLRARLHPWSPRVVLIAPLSPQTLESMLRAWTADAFLVTNKGLLHLSSAIGAWLGAEPLSGRRPSVADGPVSSRMNKSG